MTYAITGAGGYLGSRLAQHLRARGDRVLTLSRRPSPGAPDSAAFALGDAGPIAGLDHADVLVHCAYDFSVRSRRNIHERNVVGSCRLFDAARDSGIARIVLISTMSAFPGCRSLYGQAKLAIEADVLRRGGDVVRPGLIFGPHPGGMMGTLAQAARRAALLPVPLGGSQRLYLVHEADVANVVARLSQRASDARTPITAAASRPWLLPEVFRALSAAAGRHPMVLPVPWRLMWAGMKAIELTGLPSRLRSDSILSLVSQNPAPSFAEAAALGVTFRDFTPAALDM